MINFACFAPHPPLLLPDVGSQEDREKVKKTIENLELLGRKLKAAKPDCIIISSPHQDWGFNVPLYFLAKDFKEEIKTYLIEFESPAFYFEKGKKVYSEFKQGENYALIASGDLSHCLKEDGPYGFHPDGPKFDKALIEFLKKKDVKQILKLNKMFPQSANCGLPSFSFLLGILEASGLDWKPEILSYEGPFGVGYLVADFKLEQE